MEELSVILESVSTLLWPVIVIVLIVVFRPGVAALIESAKSRKFTIKVGGQELTMEEANTQQQLLLADLQDQMAEIQKRLTAGVVATPGAAATPGVPPGGGTREGIMPPQPTTGAGESFSPEPALPEGSTDTLRSARPVLWVDGNPKSNSFFLQRLQDEGSPATLAASTAEAMELLGRRSFGLIISDMGRLEGTEYNTRAGLDLLAQVRARNKIVPIVFYCSHRRSSETRELAEQGGATAVVSSPSRLSALLFD